MPTPSLSLPKIKGGGDKLMNLNVIVGFVLFFLSLMFLSLTSTFRMVCQTSDPASCADVLEGYAEDAYEKRDDEFIAKMKDPPPVFADLEHPDEATSVTACGASGWEAGVYAGPEKLDQSNQVCVALGCAPNQCLKSVQLCDGKGVNTANSEPTLTCMGRVGAWVVSPLHLAFCLASIICSLGCCRIGMKDNGPADLKAVAGGG